MAAAKGIDLKIKKGAVVLAGVQSKKISYMGEVIDTTGDDDNGYQSSLPKCGTRGLNFSVEGLQKDEVFRDLWLTSDNHMMADISIVYPDGGVVTGSFNMASYEESGEHNDAIKFSAEFQSSGAWVYVPSP